MTWPMCIFILIVGLVANVVWSELSTLPLAIAALIVYLCA